MSQIFDMRPSRDLSIGIPLTASSIRSRSPSMASNGEAAEERRRRAELSTPVVFPPISTQSRTSTAAAAARRRLPSREPPVGRRASTRTISSLSSQSPTRRSIRSANSVGAEPDLRCYDPDCMICRTLSMKDPNNLSRIARNGVRSDRVPLAVAQQNSTEDDLYGLRGLGLDAEKYRFNRKTPQLDAAINMLTQIVDERLQAERYRDAKDASTALRDLLEKRRKAEELLVERRKNLGNLERAQELKNEYDRLVFTAVDLDKIRAHLTEQQASSLAKLRRI